MKSEYQYSFSVSNAAGQLVLYYRFTLKAYEKPNKIDVENHIETLLYNAGIPMQGEKPFKKELIQIIDL
jgi:hypothetical protein